jgi:hypothetical protein
VLSYNQCCRTIIEKERVLLEMERDVKQAEKYSRRRVLVMGCGALCAAALGSGCAGLQVGEGTGTACPYGEVNDAYPGKCHRYVDANRDGFCDLGGVGAASAVE